MNLRMPLRAIRCRVLALSALLWVPVAGFAAEAVAAPAANLPGNVAAQHVGVATCASTVCHGSAAVRGNAGIQYNEYVVWSQSDPHARTWNVLLGADARRIATRLGLPNAHEAPVCLACHTDYVPAARQGAKHLYSDGIGCEACHGAASGWLQSHARAGATHADNLAQGLYPLSDPEQRADRCLSCHAGNSEKFAGHDMMGAGHPRLQFELVNWLRMQVPHYRADADYARRKQAPPDDATQWAIGQLASARNLLRTVDSPRLDAGGLWVELALFDCHACHAPMNAGKWQVRDSARTLRPGSVRLNDSALLMTALLVQVRAPQDGKLLRRGIEDLHAASQQSRDALHEKARALVAQIDRQLSTLKQEPLDARQAQLLLPTVLEFAASGRFNDYLTAEQAAMAADILMRSGQPDRYAQLAPQFDAVFTTLADQNRFQAPAFVAAVRRLRDAAGFRQPAP